MLKKLLSLSDEGNKNLKKAIFWCTIDSLVLFIPFAIIMQVMQTIIDPLVSGGALNTGRLWMLFGLGIAAAVLYFITYGIEYDKTYTTAYKESTKIRVEVAEHMRKLPLSFFNKKDLSELTTNIMEDCNTIESMMSHSVPQVVSQAITITLVCVMLAFFDWRMALAVFCVLPIAIGIIFVGRKFQLKFGEKHVQAKLNVSDQVQEYLDGIKVVKAFGLSGEKSVALERSLSQMMKEAIRLEVISGSIVNLAMMILQVGTGIVIFVGVNLLLGGSLGVISFLTFVIISVKIYAPAISILTMLPELMYFLISTKRMQSLRREPLMSGENTAKPKSCNMAFNNVGFSYKKDDVIKKMSFTIEEHGVTALVGPSGSGKSTVSRLLARFWDVTSGEITIDGENIKNIEPDQLMSYMSFVFQDVVLFNDSVMNNIRIGKQNASDEDVYNAAKMARCDSFIKEMSEGYNTLVGENGCTLSGGERQRISIARALLKDAPIVLLDEATASLDPENEVLIQEAVSALVKNRTVIVIAHRLKTIAGAKKIIVLEDGRIAQQGTHNELMKLEGLYAKLWNIQQDSLGWSVGVHTKLFVHH